MPLIDLDYKPLTINNSIFGFESMHLPNLPWILWASELRDANLGSRKCGTSIDLFTKFSTGHNSHRKPRVGSKTNSLHPIMLHAPSGEYNIRVGQIS